MRKTKLLVSSSCILLDFLCLSSCDKKNASLVNRRTATPEKMEEIKEAQRAKERAETEAQQRKAQEEERSAAHHVVVDTTIVPTPAPEEPEPGPEVGPVESQQNQNQSQNEYRSLLPSVPPPPQPVSPHDGGNIPPGQLDPDPEVVERLARALEGLPDPPPPVNANISNNRQYRQCNNSGSSSSSSSSSSSTLNIAKSNITEIAEAQSRCRVRKCSGFDINWRRRISIFETVNQTHAKLLLVCLILPKIIKS
ncbi:hypothetical protein AGMMS50233_00620 [Endomicrobiia bacterium]|nr:hypothetical protein AGMMS50233_00620 [Endomicrobiia bacterium]